MIKPRIHLQSRVQACSIPSPHVPLRCHLLAPTRPIPFTKHPRSSFPHTFGIFPRKRHPLLSVAVGAAAVGSNSSSPHQQQFPSTTSSTTTTPLSLAIEVLWPDRYLVLLTTATLLCTIGLTLAFPLALGDLFDVVRQHVASTPPLPPLPPTTTSMTSLVDIVRSLQHASASAPPPFYPVLFRLCGCLALSAAGNAGVAYLAPLLGERFALRIRRRLALETLSKDQSYFDAVGKGDITARLSLDIAVVQATVADFLGQRGIRSMLEVLCSLTIIGLKNPVLALVSFVVTPALSALLRRVVKHSASLTYARQQAAANAQSFATDRLTHVQTVQIFAAEDREAGEYAELTQEGYAMARRCAVFQGIVEGAGRLAVNIGTLSLLGLGGAFVIAGRISLGTLLAFNVYNLFLSVGLSALAGSVAELGKAAGAMQRIAEIAGTSATSTSSGVQGQDPSAVSLRLLQDDSDSDSNSSTPPNYNNSSSGGSRVELRDVWFRYNGRQDWALQGMTLSIPPGITMALVGPSGAGKSSAVALLLGLYAPQRGTITINGVELNAHTIPEARRSIGTVLQQPSLLSGTVRDQLLLGDPGATEEDMVAAATAAHANVFIDQLPGGYGAEVGERGHQLSGGQQQRISIARALVRHPQLLLLDEPTAALDVDAERAVDEALQEITGCTKIIIAHRLSTVRKADCIAVVVGGRVVELGSHEELMGGGDGGYYRKMVENSELSSDDAVAVDAAVVE